MSTNKLQHNTLCGLAAMVLFGVASARPDTLTLITDVNAQQATDSVKWSQMGADQTLLSAAGTVASLKGTSVGVKFAAANSIVSVQCPAAACSWTGQGFTAGDSLLWTSDAGNGGNGPVTLSFASGISGAGAFIGADGPGQFTATIQAYHGTTLLGSYSVLSPTNGRAVYIGLLDQTGPNVTSVVFGMAHVSAGLTTDLALDTVGFKAGSSSSAPAVRLSASALSFPAQVLSTTSAVQTVTLTNVGAAPLTISSIAASGDYSETTTCAASVAAGASCAINVTFHPSAIGTRSGTINVTDNASGSPQSVALSGTGTQVKLSAYGLNFPTTKVNAVSPPQTVTLTNVGNTALSITSIGLAGNFPGDYSQTNNCGSGVAAHGSCTLTVRFQPKVTGYMTAVILIQDNGGATPQVISLHGTGQ